MVIILGAGISGLTAAFYIKQLIKNPITILESTNRVGGKLDLILFILLFLIFCSLLGWIKSIKKDCVVIETGPRTIRPVGEGGNLIKIFTLNK